MKHEHASNGNENGARFRMNVVLIGFLVVIGYLLISEHQAHLSGVLNYLPYVLLLLCPLMHFFMHGSHGRHGDLDNAQPRGDAPNGEPK